MKPLHPPRAGLSWWLLQGQRSARQTTLQEGRCGPAWGCPNTKPPWKEGMLVRAGGATCRTHSPAQGVGCSAGSDGGTTQPPASSRVSPFPVTQPEAWELGALRGETGIGLSTIPTLGSPHPGPGSELGQRHDSEPHPPFSPPWFPAPQQDADLALTSCPAQAPAG